MAGILANSVTVVMSSGDTATTNTFPGYVTNERITLATTPTGSAYAWGLGKPSGSTARCELSDDADDTPGFTPDVGGEYIISCVVDSTTTYVLRISVTTVAQSTAIEAIRLSPKEDEDIPVPALGGALFWEAATGIPAFKDENGNTRFIGIHAGILSFNGSSSSVDNSTFTLAHYTPDTDGSYLACAVTNALDENGEVAGFIRMAQFKRKAGNVTMIGTVESSFSRQDTALSTAASTFDTDGTSIRVRATGVAALDIDWQASGQVSLLT